MQYGSAPKQLGEFKVECREMMFYQYLPIKFPSMTHPVMESRLDCFKRIIGTACCDFIADFGLNAYGDSFVYVTAKFMYQQVNKPFNRPGWHSDGFMTSDINYIWCDRCPTIFNSSKFVLSQDDKKSLAEMEQQAIPKNNYSFPDNTLLRLNQFNIHKCADVTASGMRTFLKISFSGDRYDLIGNTHNYLLDYDWEMKPRKEERNIPQSNINHEHNIP